MASIAQALDKLLLKVSAKKVQQKAQGILVKTRSFIEQEIRKHPISRELSDKTSPSKFFTTSTGTLYGLMGFTDPDDPVADLIAFIKKEIKIEVTNPKFSQIVGVAYTIRFPTYSDFRDGLEVKLDRWSAGESWIEMLELGLVSGVSRFLQSPPASTEHSYSLLGIEVLNKVRGGAESLPKRGYISEIFSKARKFEITSKS